MNEFYYKLSWQPIITKDLVQKIHDYPNYLHHQDGNVEKQRYKNLKKWPTYDEDITPILAQIPLDESFFDHFTIQTILPPGIDWHVDKNRKVSILYLLEGEAHTFFRKDRTLHGVVFEKYSWYLFNNDVLHSVKKLNTQRTALCIDLTTRFKNYQNALNYFK